MASQKNGAKWAYSGKKMYAMFGGNYNEFLALVREVRGEKAEPEDDAMITPIAGRPTKASLFAEPQSPQN
jgi:hypothetical protein